MGHDEDKNFGGGTTPVNPESVASNTRAVLGNHRIGMRPARDFSAQDELNRISGVTPQTQATGGDIVLNNTPVKKKDNKIITAFIIVAVVMAILAVVLLLVKTPWGAQGSAHIPGDYKKEFNQYANYLMSGETKEDALTGSNNGLRKYAFNNAIRGDENEKNNYLENAYKLFEDFYIDFDNASIDDVLKARVLSYYNNLKMVYLYEIGDKLDEGIILREYKNKSVGDAEDLIDKSYSKLAESDSTVAKTYADTLRMVWQLYLKQLTKYNEYGCIDKDNNIDQICVKQKIPYDDNMKALANALRSMNNMYERAMSEVISECWTISKMINNGVEE